MRVSVVMGMGMPVRVAMAMAVPMVVPMRVAVGMAVPGAAMRVALPAPGCRIHADVIVYRPRGRQAGRALHGARQDARSRRHRGRDMQHAATEAFVTRETEAILARLRAAPAIDWASMPIGEARDLFHRNNAYWNEPVIELAGAGEFAIPGEGHAMRARLYRPSSAPSLPVLLYAHGGGWTFGSVDSHDRFMRLLARESGAAVLGIDYRLAPEHPFPAGMRDTLAAIAWLRREGAAHGLDPSRLSLGGDSAGANIALSAMLALRDEGGAGLAGAVLFYGCYAPMHDTPSHRRFGGGAFGLSTERMRWYWRNHLGALPEHTTALAVPLRADLRGLPRLFLNAAGLDPLLDDTLEMAARLAHAGTPAEIDLVPGVLHGCMQQTREEPAAMASALRAARYLREILAA